MDRTDENTTTYEDTMGALAGSNAGSNIGSEMATLDEAPRELNRLNAVAETAERLVEMLSRSLSRFNGQPSGPLAKDMGPGGPSGHKADLDRLDMAVDQLVTMIDELGAIM